MPAMTDDTSSLLIDGDILEGEIEIPTDEIKQASYDQVRRVITEGRYFYLVWENDPPEAEPILLDLFTASALVKIHDALNPENQAKVEEQIAASRAKFCRYVDFCWEHIR